MFSCNTDPHCTGMEYSRPFPSHIDLSSSSFFPFSPPAFNHDSPFHDLILFPSEGHSPLTVPPPAPPFPIKETAPPSPKKNTASGGSRRRATRKDRHSKIVTAQGTRDRRMRLNLEVAPQFFHIQDMLGYDKASKTVKWLIKEAKSSIEKLEGKDRSCSKISTVASAASELDPSEDISAVSDYQNINIPTAHKRVARRPSKRASYPSALSRESRDMARARARERTRAKSNIINDLQSSLDLVAEMEEQCSTSINPYSKQLSNGARVLDELSVSILDYSSTSSLFSQDQCWEVSQFASIEDGQTRPWS